MFEPLNPILMNADTFICNLDEAMRLIQKVNRPNFGLMLDHLPDSLWRQDPARVIEAGREGFCRAWEKRESL